jgi:hypothetical protein
MKKKITLGVVMLLATLSFSQFQSASDDTQLDSPSDHLFIEPNTKSLTEPQTNSFDGKTNSAFDDENTGLARVKPTNTPEVQTNHETAPPLTEAQRWYSDDSIHQTEVINPTKMPLEGVGENSLPFIVQDIYQQLQQQIDNWTLSESEAIHYQLNVSNLFDDPDNDLLSSRISLNLAGVKLSGNHLITLSGTPKTTASPSLTIAAQDSYHGEQWVEAHFTLPSINHDLATQHPLEGELLFRLESSNEFAGQYTLYEVVYCQAFKFINQEVYFATASNRSHCPTEAQLTKVGSYHIDNEHIVISNQNSYLAANQRWQLQHQYPSSVKTDVTNYFVSVHDGNQYESYTMQKDVKAMEQRLSAMTGQYLFQITWFDYLLPIPNHQFLPIKVGNYLFDHQENIAGPNNETIDSDLNLKAHGTSLNCENVATWYDVDVVGGQGEYGIELVSSSDSSNPRYNVECLEYISNPETGQISLAFDAAYTPYDKFVDGEIYSYILRPKPQYADKVEELKINMIYRQP